MNCVQLIVRVIIFTWFRKRFYSLQKRFVAYIYYRELKKIHPLKKWITKKSKNLKPSI